MLNLLTQNQINNALKYKGFYIWRGEIFDQFYISKQLNSCRWLFNAKSIRAAKCKITRLINKG